LVAKFREHAARIGLNLLDSATPIQPVVIGPAEAALALSQALEGRGILATAIRPPTVPQGSARIRITLTAAHTDADLAALLDALEQELR
jgi:8-amino-7-oxononanoate synthase